MIADDIPPNRMVGYRVNADRNRLSQMGVTESLQVVDGETTIAFTFEDMMAYHGPHSPAGVAMAFKVMQRAFGHLSAGLPPPRRSVAVRTAFRGPGARDGFEVVTRGVTEGRYMVDRSAAAVRPRAPARGFRLRGRPSRPDSDILLRDGFVTEEFIDLGPHREANRPAGRAARRIESRTGATHPVPTPAADVFDVADG